MSKKTKQIVIEELQNNIKLSNAEIARNIVEKKYKEFGHWHVDSIRRFVSKCRHKFLKEDTNSFTVDNGESYKFKKNENGTADLYSNIDRRITSLEDLVKEFKIDLNVWKVKSWECSSYESHTRLRHYDTDGKRLDDEHKVVPLYRVHAKLEENRPLINLLGVKDDILEELKSFSPKYGKIKYEKFKNACLLEINIFDLHFGKLTWDEETGENFDIKIARELFLSCIHSLISQSKSYNIDKVLFVVGNDFFNVDNRFNTTSSGTPQDEDTRWKKTFKRGRQLIVEAIDILQQIAPVDVVVVPGNHDMERAFYLGDALECWYNNNPNVVIDNSAPVRKYYQYGKCLIGYTHGKDEKVAELPLIMASEVPEKWNATKYREWHLGDKHHKREIKWISTEEFKGTTVRFMRTLTSTDAWHYSKGYINNLRAGEGFIWDANNGLVCQFSANL